jgi:hypothetical protein
MTAFGLLLYDSSKYVRKWYVIKDFCGDEEDGYDAVVIDGKE